MTSAFPGAIDSFTTKVDGIDDIMADHVNDLQNAIVAIETPLIQILAGGWIPDSDTWVYVSANSFKIVGKDVTVRFPAGTKIRLKQTTNKYFYVSSAILSGSDTVVTIYAGTDYTLANAAITEPYYSYASSPTGFPGGFMYTPEWTASTTNPTLGNGAIYGRFFLIGKACNFSVDLNIGSTTNKGSGNWFFGLPFEVANPSPGIYNFSGIAHCRDTGTASYIRAVVIERLQQAQKTAYFIDVTAGSNSLYITPTVPFTWDSGDLLRFNITYEIA